MSFSLILLQQKIPQLISQYLVNLKEYLLLHTAGCHHHLHFCLIFVGLHNLLNELYWRKRRINFCFRHQKYINIFVNYMLQGLKRIPQRIYVKLCKDQPTDVLWRIFSKALRGSVRASLLRFDWISFGSLKVRSSLTDLWPELRKEPEWLTSWWMLYSGIELLTPKTMQRLCNW